MTAATVATLRALTMLTGPADPAESPAFSLVWRAPGSCPDESAVRDAISRSLVSSDAGTPRVRAVANVSERRGRYRLELALQQGGDSGNREIESGSCVELADLTAWFVAVAVDPRLSARPRIQVPSGRDASRAGPSEASSVEEPQPPTRSAAASSSPVSPAADGSRTRSSPDRRTQSVTSTTAPGRGASSRVAIRRQQGMRATVMAGTGIEGGVLPAVGLVLSVATGLERGPLRAEVAGWYAAPRRHASPQNEDVGGTFQAGAAALRACGVPRSGRVLFPLCIAVEAGAISGAGTGDLEPRRATAFWAGLGPRAGVLWRFRRRAGLRLDAQASFSLLRPTFSTTPSGVVFQPSVLGARAVGGVEFVLP
jgi:hypothetical protein